MYKYIGYNSNIIVPSPYCNLFPHSILNLVVTTNIQIGIRKIAEQTITWFSKAWLQAIFGQCQTRQRSVWHFAHPRFRSGFGFFLLVHTNWDLFAAGGNGGARKEAEAATVCTDTAISSSCLRAWIYSWLITKHRWRLSTMSFHAYPARATQLPNKWIRQSLFHCAVLDIRSDISNCSRMR